MKKEIFFKSVSRERKDNGRGAEKDGKWEKIKCEKNINPIKRLVNSKKRVCTWL